MNSQNVEPATTIATVVLNSSGELLPVPRNIDIVTGQVMIKNDTDMNISVKVAWVSGTDEYELSGNVNAQEHLRFGLFDDVICVSVCTSEGRLSGETVWSGPTHIDSLNNVSSTITIDADGNVIDPLGVAAGSLSENVSPSTTANVLCSTGGVRVVNDSRYVVCVYDSMDAEHPRATIDADAAETFVHLYGEDNSEPDVKSILLFSTSTSMTCEEAQVSPMIVVRYATKPVVCIYYDDITETQAAYPEIVQPGSDSMIYLINTSDKVATVYLNGTLAEDQLVESRASRPGARLDVAPQGGLYAVSVADLDFSRPVVLKWDIDGDPKVVVMRPPTPPT